MPAADPPSFAPPVPRGAALQNRAAAHRLEERAWRVRDHLSPSTHRGRPAA